MTVDTRAMYSVDACQRRRCDRDGMRLKEEWWNLGSEFLEVEANQVLPIERLLSRTGDPFDRGLAGGSRRDPDRGRRQGRRQGPDSTRDPPGPLRVGKRELENPEPKNGARASRTFEGPTGAPYSSS